MPHLTASTPALARRGIEKIVAAYNTDSKQRFQDLIGEEVRTTLSFIRLYEEGDFDYANTIAEGTPMVFDDWSIPYTMDVTPKIRVVGWEATREGQQSDQYGLYAKAANKLRAAMQKTMERNVADFYNNGTSTSAGYKTADGLAAFSTAHLYDGGTWANQPTTDIAFGALALEQALQELMDQKGHRGDPMPADGPFILVLPTALWGVGNRVVGSDQLAQSANNDPNVAKGSISKVHVNPWLNDTNNWFLIPAAKSDRTLCVCRRTSVTVKTDYDINVNMDKWRLDEMYALFWKSARRMWGTFPS